MRLSLRIFVCLALGIATAGTGLALNPDRTITQYLHRIRQPLRGNQQAYIFALKQTRDHYLWLGTMDGVLRYDGDRFAPVPALQQAGAAFTASLDQQQFHALGLVLVGLALRSDLENSIM